MFQKQSSADTAVEQLDSIKHSAAGVANNAAASAKEQMAQARAKKGQETLCDLLTAGDTWTVE